MSTNRINYPHAVLGNGDDIEPSIKMNDIEVSTMETFDNGLLRFNVTFSLNNIGIQKLISEGYAKYAVEITSKLCPLRVVFQNDQPVVPIELNKMELGPDAILFPSIVVVREINECNIPGINPIFEGLPTGRSIGEYLAIYNKWSIEQKKNISSIMKFVKGANFVKHPLYSFKEEYISITLPPAIYKKYEVLNEKNKSINEIIHSSLVTEALYNAFNLIREGAFSDKMWHKQIKSLTCSLSDYKNCDFKSVIEYPEIINEILRNPTERMFISLENLVNGN